MNLFICYLCSQISQIQGYELNRQIGFDFAARDDLVIQAYLSLPPDVSNSIRYKKSFLNLQWTDSRCYIYDM